MTHTVSELRMAEIDLGISVAGMPEVVGVHPEVYRDMRSYKRRLMAGEAVWERINDALKLKRIKEGM